MIEWIISYVIVGVIMLVFSFKGDLNELKDRDREEALGIAVWVMVHWVMFILLWFPISCYATYRWIRYGEKSTKIW